MTKKITKISNKLESQVLFWQDRAHKDWGNIVDIIALKNNLKPLIVSLAESEEKIRTRKKICEKAKLIFDYKSYKATSEARYNQLFPNRTGIRYNIYISKNRKLINQAKKIISQGFTINKKYSSEQFGLLLGYPSCCVKNFLKGKNAVEHLKPYILNKIPFYNNNLLTGSRSNCHLSSYEPCSYTCKKTTELNKKILEALKKEIPDYYQFLEKYLKKPLVIWINNQWPEFGLLDSMVSIVFDGSLEDGMLKYQKIYPHFPINRAVKLVNFPSKTDLWSLAEGNKLAIEKKHIKVYKNNLLLDKIKRSQYSAILVQPY